MAGSWDAPQSTFDAKGPLAREQLELFYVTVWVCTFLFITVGGGLLWAMIRYREREGDSDEAPRQVHGHLGFESAFVVAAIGMLIIIIVPTVEGIWMAGSLPEKEPYYEKSKLGNWYTGSLDGEAEEEVLEIIVRGWQWWWSFEYPQLGITTANEFYMPAGKVVRFTLRAADVIHSFWIPKLGGKVDLIPGKANWMWLMAGEGREDWAELKGEEVSSLPAEKQQALYKQYIEEEILGYYFGQCTEFCGEGHAYMLFRAEVVNDEDFIEWVAKTQKGAKAPLPFGTESGDSASERKQGWDSWQAANLKGKVPDDPLNAGAKLFMGKGRCLVCHAIVNSPAQGNSAPDLTFVGERKSLGAGILNHFRLDGSIDKTRQLDHFYKWIRNSQDLKPGSHMYYREDAGLIKLKTHGLTYQHLLKLGFSEEELLDTGISEEELQALREKPAQGIEQEIHKVGIFRRLTEAIDRDPEKFRQLPQYTQWLSDEEWKSVARFLQSLK